jgi:hypothetical protein
MEHYHQSESIKHLAQALAKAQFCAFKAVKSKNNKFFNSGYADLESCWETIREPLTDNGLAVVQMPHGENGLVTTLLHESGEWISSLMIQNIKDPLDVQKRGSKITYMRRFALMAAVGISAVNPTPEDGDHEDDDGT